MGEAVYTSTHIQTLFGIAGQTVRNWSTEFKEYLSANASPGTGRHRFYTREDLEVFALVADMRRRGMTSEDIHASLRTGQRGEAPDIDPGQMQSLIHKEQAQAGAALIARMETQIADLRSQLEAATTERDQLAKENIRLSTLKEVADERAEKAEEKAQQLQTRIEELQRELGRLEGKASAE